MPDRDQVIKGLRCRGKERCGYFCERTGACYYAQPAFSIDGEVIGYGCNTERLCSEALELLKEQEPMPIEKEPIPVVVRDDEEWYMPELRCPECNVLWMSYREDTHYCPNCGRSVKWE